MYHIFLTYTAADPGSNLIPLFHCFLVAIVRREDDNRFQLAVNGSWVPRTLFKHSDRSYCDNRYAITDFLSIIYLIYKGKSSPIFLRFPWNLNDVIIIRWLWTRLTPLKYSSFRFSLFNAARVVTVGYSTYYWSGSSVLGVIDITGGDSNINYYIIFQH